MAGIEIREYCGDFSDLVEFNRRVWLPQYAGKMWFSLPDLITMRSWGQEGGCIAAYDGSQIVGSIFSIPCSLRVTSSVLPAALLTGLAVDPDHGRTAWHLVERVRRLHEERGIALGIGGFASDRTSASYRFWMTYARTFPQRQQFLFRAGHWFKMLAPDAFARAGITVGERIASRTLGYLFRPTPLASDPHVRSCRAGDLDRCAQMLNDASANCDWSMVWSAKKLASDLEDPTVESLVVERKGYIQGMVRYRHVVIYGREPVRAAAIDLFADDGLSRTQRVRFLGHVCNHLRQGGVHLLLALRCAMTPVSTFAANLFLPPTAPMYVHALLTRPELAQIPPKTWSLVLS